MAMNKVLGLLKQADLDHNLICDGDRIAIGLSYGKDSMCLVEALRLYKFFSKKQYEIVAINIDLGFKPVEEKIIKDYLSKNDIPFYKVTSEPSIYEVLKLHIKDDKLPCSICSKMKKAAICKAAKKYNCNKVAFAHHGDDAVETLLLNAVYGGRLATFKIKTYLDREDITLIRPLAYLKEKDIINTVRTSNIPFLKSTCPNDKNTMRQEMKELLHDLYKKYPSAKNNFLLMLSNEEKQELWKKEKRD